MHASHRTLTCALILAPSLLALGGPAMAATATGPVAVVKQMMADFDKGDMKAAEAAYAKDIAITDEFAPYEWHGPDAMANWSKGYDAFTKSAGWSDAKAASHTVTRADVNGDAAYVVVSEVFTYKQQGHPMSESGMEAFTLHKGAGGWKITGSAWAGHRAAPAKSAAAAPPASAPAKKS